jgi:hypothetical protein
MYSFVVSLHIISAGVIIGLITNAIMGTMMRKKIKGTPAELASIRTGAIMAPIMANIGSIGLLLTGVILTLMQYSFFPFSTLPWLAIMQTDYIVIMAISGAVMMPTGKKILAMANSELASPGAAKGASDALRALVAKQYTLTMVIAFLVLIAILVGESKDMMWVKAVQ